MAISGRRLQKENREYDADRALGSKTRILAPLAVLHFCKPRRGMDSRVDTYPELPGNAAICREGSRRAEPGACD